MRRRSKRSATWPGGQQEKQTGEKKRQPGVAEIERTMGDGIDLPGDRYRLRLRAKDRYGAGQLIQPEVARGKGFQTSSVRFCRRGIHLLSRVSRRLAQRTGMTWSHGRRNASPANAGLWGHGSPQELDLIPVRCYCQSNEFWLQIDAVRVLLHAAPVVWMS